MTYTPTKPEGSTPGMFGPGQKEQLAAFLKEEGVNPGLNTDDDDLGDDARGQEESEEEGEGLILGKFKSQEDLAKAYKELERKLGAKDQGDQGDQGDQDQPEPLDPATYTKEIGAERYGQAMADLFERAGFNPLDVEAKIEKGELELSAAAEQMAEVLPFSKTVIETYLNGLYEVEGGPPADQGAEFTEADEQEIRAVVGGDKAFAKLTAWAKDNLEKADLQAYNEAVTSGNKVAALMAVKFLQASAQAKGAPVEPKLVGTGSAPSVAATKFESTEQALEAMNKRNTRGERFYDVDPAYRQKVAEIVARSDISW